MSRSLDHKSRFHGGDVRQPHSTSQVSGRTHQGRALPRGPPRASPSSRMEVMPSRDCPPATDLHPALAARFSPVLFDESASVSSGQVDVLLEAARRAPSAGNSQPWKFIVGRRGDTIHQRLMPHLARSSRVWAPSAALLVVNLAHVLVQGSDWEFSEFSRYDLGQAVAHMTIQGLAMGLDSHQFRAFERDGLALEFDVPEHLEVTSMTAFGKAAHAAESAAGPGTSRDRANLATITWARA